MATNRVGRRVKILGGMKEFVGKTGQIVGYEKYSRNPMYYRVALDEPVEILGVGLVTDDLWQGQYLRNVR